jgi:hypothetical protein
MSAHSEGFIRLRRSPLLAEITLDHNAAALLLLIASRARWHNGPNKHNLKIGEAIVGDYKAAGLTRRKYREALRRLEHQWQQITTRPTNRGTIVKLTESAIFDLSSPPRREAVQKRPPNSMGETATQRPANGHLTASQRPLTNNDNKGTKKDTVSKAVGNSLAESPDNLVDELSQKFSSSKYQYQNQPGWNDYAKYCASQRGRPTDKGYITWSGKQKYLRPNTSKTVLKETLYYHPNHPGEQFNGAQVAQLARNVPDHQQDSYLSKFKRATCKPDGTIHTL